MTPQYPTGPNVPLQPPSGGNDKTTLFGVLGIVLSLCCVPLGVVFAFLSMNEAKKVGKPTTLAMAGFIVAGVSLTVSIVAATLR